MALSLTALQADQLAQYLVHLRQYAGRVNVKGAHHALRVDDRHRTHRKPALGIEDTQAFANLAVRIEI